MTEHDASVLDWQTDSGIAYQAACVACTWKGGVYEEHEPAAREADEHRQE